MLQCLSQDITTTSHEKCEKRSGKRGSGERQYQTCHIISYIHIRVKTAQMHSCSSFENKKLIYAFSSISSLGATEVLPSLSALARAESQSPFFWLIIGR